MARAGRHRHKVRVERVAESRDGRFGQVAEDWSLFDERWADQVPSGGREFVAAQQAHAELTHVLTTRWDPSKVIHPKDRVIWDGATLEILAAPKYQMANRNIEQRLSCRELVVGG